MKLMVKRGSGNKLSPEPIINNLCNSIIPAKNCGKAYLYENGFNKKIYNLELQFINTKCGDIIEVQDSTIGVNFRTKVKSWSLNVSQNEGSVIVRMNLTLERSIINE